MTRDQQRALHAYECVASVKEYRKEYRTLVNGLGGQIIRSGLAGTMAYLERFHRKEAAAQLLEHLASAGIPGLGKIQGAELPARVRELELEPYMLATRETLKVAQWLKRAVQATMSD